MPIERICQTCGKSFKSSKSRIELSGSKFCSWPCFQIRVSSDKCKRRIGVLTCSICGKSFDYNGKGFKRKTCSEGCMRKQKAKAHTGMKYSDVSKKYGPANGHWKGGRFERKDGYIIINAIKSGQRGEHRVIAERVLGRRLATDEVVHHINGCRGDNRNCNLLICKQGYHAELHWKMGELYAQEHFG